MMMMNEARYKTVDVKDLVSSTPRVGSLVKMRVHYAEKGKISDTPTVMLISESGPMNFDLLDEVFVLLGVTETFRNIRQMIRVELLHPNYGRLTWERDSTWWILSFVELS